MTTAADSSSSDTFAERPPDDGESLLIPEPTPAAETDRAPDEDLETEVPAYVARSESPPSARITIAIGPFRVRPAVLAWGVSIAFHAALAAASLMVISWRNLHARGIDGPGWGDGAPETGMIDTPGEAGGPPGLMAQALPNGPASASEAPPGLPDSPAADAAESLVAQAAPEPVPAEDEVEGDEPVAQSDISASALHGLASLTTPHRPPTAPAQAPASTAGGAGNNSAATGNATTAGANPGAGTAATAGGSAGASNGTGPGRTGDGGLAFSGRPGTSDGVRGRHGLARPTYPVESRRRGEQGTVVLDVEVLPDGTVGNVRVAADPGYPRLVDAAVAQVKRERFTRLIENGRAVPYQLTIPYDFRLR